MKKLLYIVILTMFAICACDDRPKGVLSRGEMEDVLYDYHIAQGLIEQLPDSVREKVAQDYINAVYQKHDITEAQFDSSIVYYNRNTRDLLKIYDNLKERFGEASEAIQMETGTNDMTAIFAGGDTANIWSSSPMMLLRAKDFLCTESFTIHVDTAFHRKDQFIMTFYPILMREHADDRDINLNVGLSVVYKNGKTIGTTRQVSYSGIQQMSIKAIDNQDIDKITGYFFFKGKNDARNFCVVNGISLVRMHDEQQEEEKTDSVKTDTIKTDTLPKIEERRLTPEEVRQENKTGNKIEIQSAPSVRTPNSYGPRRKNQRRR